MLPEHVTKVDPLIQSVNLSQYLQYSTHIHRRILDMDMVFDISNTNPALFLLAVTLQ